MSKVTTSKALGVILRDARKHKHITQSQLANLAGGIKQATVSKFENDPSNAQVETLFKLASALGLEIHLVEKTARRSSGDETW